MLILLSIGVMNHEGIVFMTEPMPIQCQVGTFYTVREEIANIVTHAIGSGLSVAMLTILVMFAATDGDIWRIVSVSIYGGCMILCYLASTIYHSVVGRKWKLFMRRFDHAAIYLLIAGTYTPFLLVNMRDSVGWYHFTLVWGLALIGVIYKLLFTSLFEWVAVATYALLGLLCLFIMRPMLVSLSGNGFTWLAVGGGCYLVGIIFYAWRKLPYNHAIWHCFVIAGTIFHFFSVLFSVVLA